MATTNKEDKNPLEERLNNLESKFANTMIKSIEKITNELEDELKKEGELLGSSDKRFDRIRALLNDAPKTIETMKLMKKLFSKSGNTDDEGDDEVKATSRNGKTVHNSGVDKKVAI